MWQVIFITIQVTIDGIYVQYADNSELPENCEEISKYFLTCQYCFINFSCQIVNKCILCHITYKWYSGEHC